METSLSEQQDKNYVLVDLKPYETNTHGLGAPPYLYVLSGPIFEGPYDDMKVWKRELRDWILEHGIDVEPPKRFNAVLSDYADKSDDVF